MTYNYYQQPYGYNSIAPLYSLPSQASNNGFNWVQGEAAANNSLRGERGEKNLPFLFFMEKKVKNITSY